MSPVVTGGDRRTATPADLYEARTMGLSNRKIAVVFSISERTVRRLFALDKCRRGDHDSACPPDRCPGKAASYDARSQRGAQARRQATASYDALAVLLGEIRAALDPEDEELCAHERLMWIDAAARDAEAALAESGAA